MKTILKKNQIIISVIAVMLIAAGYMNYTANAKNALQTAALTDTEQYGQLGDATLVSANLTQDDNNNQNIESNIQEKNETTENNINSNITAENNEIIGNAISTSNSNITTDSTYFTESRLEREKMYSQMIESYQNILNNTQMSETQKEISQNEIKKINDTKNAIMITENLIKNKGFDDIIIFVNGESISVVIKANSLSQEQIAQVQNIVSRELKSDIDNIHISNKR